ncbi:hypothetical protein QLX08_005156 [Tetragonisca angustula]|uniref:Uncharacterized protein n=1 Tax=Tetragonisca angustula TaxID=166442 RepID=A0AAW0ZZM3_9HYME
MSSRSSSAIEMEITQCARLRFSSNLFSLENCRLSSGGELKIVDAACLVERGKVTGRISSNIVDEMRNVPR